jgi:hypothetical protein
MSPALDATLRKMVRDRAGCCCEYCLLPDSCDPLPFCVDHIIAQQHLGATVEHNLAWSCFSCNTHKGPNIAGIDPVSRRLTRLFHPRRDAWTAHFSRTGAELNGLSAVGRATLQVLNINDAERVEHRRLLMALGEYPLDV